jgi:hypothetical protein
MRNRKRHEALKSVEYRRQKEVSDPASNGESTVNMDRVQHAVNEAPE